jgi:predicted transcriptional regulator
MSKRLTEIAAEIVQNQISRSPMSSEGIVASLKSVFGALMLLKKAEGEDVSLDEIPSGEAMEATRQGMNPEDSIQEDRIICLECGAEKRQLTAKHLESHGLSAREYKKKWGFPLRQSLAAKSLSKSRSRAAKKRGLPPNLREYLDARQQRKTDAPAVEIPVAPIEPEITARKRTVIRRPKKTPV